MVSFEFISACVSRSISLSCPDNSRKRMAKPSASRKNKFRSGLDAGSELKLLAAVKN